MLLAQISDLHLAGPEGPRPAGLDTDAVLAGAVARLNALDPRPDGCVLTGDLVERPGAEVYERLRELLSGLRMPWWPMVGNHDDRALLRAAWPGAAGLGAGPADAFVHYTVEDLPLRLVMLDSLRLGSHIGELCGERLAWLEAQLAAQPARPTIVFVHHPPLQVGVPHLDRSGMAPASAAALGEIVRRHPQVERIACGHLHRAQAARWHGTLVTVCPGLAHQFALDLREQGRYTPADEGRGYQLHRWHDGCLTTYTARLDA